MPWLPLKAPARCESEEPCAVLSVQYAMPDPRTCDPRTCCDAVEAVAVAASATDVVQHSNGLARGCWRLRQTEAVHLRLRCSEQVTGEVEHPKMSCRVC